MAKVVFKVPTNEDIAKHIFAFVRELKEDYKKVILIDIPLSLISEIMHKNFSKIKEDLVKEVNKHHNVKDLEGYKIKLENEWDLLNNKFFFKIEDITGFKFEYDTYICYITKIIRSMYLLENEIIVNPYKTIAQTNFVIGEEILHLHYWDMWRKSIKNVKMPWKLNSDIWKISEVIPEFILKDERFREFGWCNIKRNYLFIENIKEKLNPFWENRKDFKEFVIKINNEQIIK